MHWRCALFGQNGYCSEYLSEFKFEHPYLRWCPTHKTPRDCCPNCNKTFNSNGFLLQHCIEEHDCENLEAAEEFFAYKAIQEKERIEEQQRQSNVSVL